MNDQEILNMWQAQDEKLDTILSINREIVKGITLNKLNKKVRSLRSPKWFALLFGIPYTLILYLVTFIGYHAGGVFVVIGFTAISLIMTFIIIGYIYHLFLIHQIRQSSEIMDVQKKLAHLKVSSFNILRIAIIQLPFWSLCWVSSAVFKESPFLYGGVNTIIFLALAVLAFWIFKNLSLENRESRMSKFFLSGVEWEPIIKSSEILEQLKELEGDY